MIEFVEGSVGDFFTQKLGIETNMCIDGAILEFVDMRSRVQAFVDYLCQIQIHASDQFRLVGPPIGKQTHI